MKSLNIRNNLKIKKINKKLIHFPISPHPRSAVIGKEGIIRRGNQASVAPLAGLCC